MNYPKDILYRVALTMLPNVGPVISRNLISACGSPEAVFKESKARLLKIPLVRDSIANTITSNSSLSQAEQEIGFIMANGIHCLWYLDDGYPFRLKECSDAPALLYFDGAFNFPTARYIGIVGTRKATPYGLSFVNKLVSDLADSGIVVVSGLAFGIDIEGHRAALNNGLATIGVVAHGLKHLYPSAHRVTSEKMKILGGILTEFPHDTIAEKDNFPARNRIVAGLCDAVVVVESAISGGALITAEFANNYNREVFALPGRTNDHFSQGCNQLIKSNKAAMVESAADIIRWMNWDVGKPKTRKSIQQSLFVSLDENEQKLVELVRIHQSINLDALCIASGFTSGETSARLLQLELKGVLRTMPGKMVELC